MLIFYYLLVNVSVRTLSDDGEDLFNLHIHNQSKWPFRKKFFLYPQTRLAWKLSLLFYNLVMNLKKYYYSEMNCRQGNIRRGKLLLSLQHVQNDLKSQLRIEIVWQNRSKHKILKQPQTVKIYRIYIYEKRIGILLS